MKLSVYSAVFFLLSLGTAIADEAKLWQAIRGDGHVALMRHALAPGIGDPENFTLEDCGTQRNLSDDGRAQARHIGDRFRANGIAAARVFTSQWCRCVETAELLGLGRGSALPALNSFFRETDRRDPQTETLRRWIAKQPKDGPLVLVTHQVNISALTGRYTSSGEIVVARRRNDGQLQVIGSIQID